MLAQFEQRLQQLQLYCRHKTDHLLTGHYHSAFKGQGIEFDEVRPYAVGDDVRVIDWNVTARTGEVYIKRFHEERELNVIFVIDNSPSFTWSSEQESRQYVSAQLCGLIGSAALANNDRIGILRFSDGVDEFIPPKHGRSQLMRCLSEVLQPAKSTHATQTTRLSLAIEHLSQLKLKRSIIVILSDFITPSNEIYHESLAILARKHELLAIAVDDPCELAFGKSGLLTVQDTESKNQLTIDMADTSIRETFSQQMQNRLKQRELAFTNIGVDLLAHTLGNDPIETLLAFFQTRRLRANGETGG